MSKMSKNLIWKHGLVGIQAYFVRICPLIAILAALRHVTFKWGQVKTEIYWPTWQVDFNFFPLPGIQNISCFN